MHLEVNSLSLMLPLIAAHGLLGRRFFDVAGLSIRWAEVVKFDAVYYIGVVAMVGFWLSMGEEPTPLSNWALFAASYLPLVLCEPLFTCLVALLLHQTVKPQSANTLRVLHGLRTRREAFFRQGSTKPCATVCRRGLGKHALANLRHCPRQNVAGY